MAKIIDVRKGKVIRGISGTIRPAAWFCWWCNKRFFERGERDNHMKKCPRRPPDTNDGATT